MNKKALKEFAVYARNELRNQIALRAQAFGITSEGSPVLTTGADYLEVNGKKLDLIYRNSIQKLLKEIETKGYDNIIEEVAYTWFNRLIAIRFMEVHNYLPAKVRILSSETKGKIDPDILTEYQYTDLPVNKEEVAKSIALGNREEAFRKLLVAQCNELHEIMPFLFEKVADYTELLLPETLLHADSLINKLGKELEDENFEQVEVIGWLYQYYISEKKDEVFAGLKKNKKINKENIPAATQLFTPHWIVRYMVENSLGQMWLESHPESNIKEEMKYYVEPAEQEAEVQAKLEELRNPNLSPEEITIMDPACGSGHILVYAFDLLYKIYEERGYPIREIPALILEKNLYGIDIDDRAAQLASFALIMKAREKTKRIFRKILSLNIISIEESNNILINQTAELIGEDTQEVEELKELLNTFFDAKNFGSILKVERVNFNKYLQKISYLQHNIEPTLDNFEVYEQMDKIRGIIVQAKVLASQYDIVITNPPYMGGKGMNLGLISYARKHYNDSKADLYAIFMDRCKEFTKIKGFHAEINQQSWMFLNSYVNLRQKLLNTQTIYSLLHLGPRTFEEIGGEVVQSTSFILRNIGDIDYYAKYYRLNHIATASDKKQSFIERKHEYIKLQQQYKSLPGFPISYWASDYTISLFENSLSFNDVADAKAGISTTDNNKMLRYWHEIESHKIGFNVENREVAKISDFKWFPYNKGGSFRKWYGNQEYVVNWKDDGKDIRNLIASDPKKQVGGRLVNLEYMFRQGTTWSDVTSGGFSARYVPKGFLFDSTGPTLFSEGEEKLFVGYMNSKPFSYILALTSTGLHFNTGQIKIQPFLNFKDNNKKDSVIEMVNHLINISQKDWDEFETSWNFDRHPFVIKHKHPLSLALNFKSWETYKYSQIHRLQQYEEKLNEIFIELYSFQKEINPKVPNEEIAIRRADRLRDTKSFLSYCVGLIMGRYSLDVEGLAYAGGEWNPNKYDSFLPDQDAIIPLTDTAYFEDDIISRLQELLALMFGEETLNENLQWLAESLTMKNNETPVERLRRYFFDEFYQDHCKVYQKRPIYWMAESGKKKGFRALFYLHRYTPETLATMRFSYVQNLQEKLTQEQKRLEQDLVNPDLKATTKKRYEKQLNIIKVQQDELVEFDKSLAELANQRIALDLDDGVVVNYAKLQNILAKIK